MPHTVLHSAVYDALQALKKPLRPLWINQANFDMPHTVLHSAAYDALQALKKPLRPLWINQASRLFADMVCVCCV